MKLLYITAREVNIKTMGGHQATHKNFSSLEEILGKGKVEPRNLGSDVILPLKLPFIERIRKRLLLLRCIFFGLTPEKLKEIVKDAPNFDFIFLDSSVYGIIAYKIKKSGFKGKVFTFFHNVEFKIHRQHLNLNPERLLQLITVRRNEKMACKYSDVIIALNNRDLREITQLYPTVKSHIIPISLKDVFTSPATGKTSIPPTLLFVGMNWYANIHGLKWFVREVLDHVDAKLQIVGMNMESLRSEFEHPKIEFLGFVKDMSTVMNEADYIVSPIFIGSGMKVKTCEALMYGKNIIGTKESFEGYDVDYEKVGALCNTKEEFISFINTINSKRRNRFNQYSRDYFLNMYSFEATLPEFKKLLFED